MNRRSVRRRLRRGQRQEKLRRAGPWIGGCGLLAVLWLAIASSLFAPWWGVGLYIVVILVVSLQLRRLARADPARCARLPVYAAAAWLVITVSGTTLAGWAPA